jgi:hypothetical protein
VFSGAFRKWVTGPGALSNGIFFVQLLFPFAFYFFVKKAELGQKFQNPVMVTLFVIYSFVAALNPMNHTPYHGFFGLIVHLPFWLCVTAYYSKRPFFEIEKLTNLLIMILIGEVILASVQYALPGDHILNKLSTGAENDALVGSSVRASGTFSFVAGLQALVIFYGFFIWSLLIRRYPSFIIAIVFGLALFAGLVNGSRGPVAILIVISLFGFFFTGYFPKRLFNLSIQIGILVLLLYLFGGNLVAGFDNAYKNFEDRVELGNENQELELRIGDAINEMIDFKGKYPIYGIGLGSTYQGANVLFGQSAYAKEYGYYEAEGGRIILEGGYILFLLRIILFIILLRYSYLPVMGKIFIFILFMNISVVFNTYIGVFFFLGFMFVDRAYYLQKVQHGKK